MKIINIFTICLTTVFGSFCDVCASGKIDLQSRIRDFIASVKDPNSHRGFNQKKLLKVLNQFDKDYKELENEIQSEEQKFNEVQEELNSIREKYESPNLIKTVEALKKLDDVLILLHKCVLGRDVYSDSSLPVYGYAKNTSELYCNYFLSPNESISKIIEKKDEIMKIIDLAQGHINDAKQQIQDAKSAMEQYKPITQKRQDCDDKMIFCAYADICLICQNIRSIHPKYQFAKMDIEYIKRTNKAYNRKYNILQVSIGGPVRAALFDEYNKLRDCTNIDREFIQKSLPKIEASKPKDSST